MKRSRIVWVLATLFSLAACTGPAPVNPGGGGATGTVEPGKRTTITEGGSTLELPAGEFLLTEGQGATPFDLNLSQDLSDANIDLDADELLLSPIFTLDHDEEIEIPLKGGLFGTLTLPFDASLLPGGVTPDASNVVLKSQHTFEAEDLSDVTGQTISSLALGEVDAAAGILTVSITALPERADIAVVYSPNLVIVGVGDVSTSAVPAWPANEAKAFYIATDPTLLGIVAAVEGNSDPSTVDRFVRDRIIARVTASLGTYEVLGLRHPNLDVFPGPPPAFVIGVFPGGSGFERPRGSDPFGALRISPTMLDPSWRPSGNDHKKLAGLVHHELFHPIVNQYGIRSIRLPFTGTETIYSDRGFQEGLAAVLGSTLELSTSNAADVRCCDADEVLSLNQPLGFARWVPPWFHPYANQDFFAYLVRKYTSNFGFLAGDDGLLERMKVEAAALGSGANEEQYRVAYLRALEHAVGAAGGDLHVAFDAFIRNRFYEHDAESNLRPSDTDPANTARTDRFKSGSPDAVASHTIASSCTFDVGDGKAVDLGNLGNMLPMSAVVLELVADATFEGALELDFNFIRESLAADKVRITVYRDGSGGTPITGNQHVETGFGGSYNRLFVLIVNTSLGGAAALTIDVKAAAKTSLREIHTNQAVCPLNQVPLVDAGPDRTVTLPDSASLDGTVVDDGVPDPPGTLTVSWSKGSGPGTVTFTDANSEDTTASFSAPGEYVLELEASDGDLSGSDSVTVIVEAAPVEIDVTGTWSTSFGTMELTQSGSTVTGTYSTDNGRIVEGEMNGTVLTGFWVEDLSGVECGSAKAGSVYWGGIEFRFDINATGFSGSWGYCEGSLDGGWSGTRQ